MTVDFLYLNVIMPTATTLDGFASVSTLLFSRTSPSLGSPSGGYVRDTPGGLLNTTTSWQLV